MEHIGTEGIAYHSPLVLSLFNRPTLLRVLESINLVIAALTAHLRSIIHLFKLSEWALKLLT